MVVVVVRLVVVVVVVRMVVVRVNSESALMGATYSTISSLLLYYLYL